MAERNTLVFNKQVMQAKALKKTPEEKKTLFDKQYDEKLKHSDNLLKNLLFAKKNCGKNSFSIASDLFRLQRGDGKLTLKEYFSYQLYDDKKYSKDDKAKFISERIHWPITHKCCDMSWSGLTEDKWLSYNFLEKFGIKVPETIAIIDKTFRSFGSHQKISSPHHLRKFLKDTDSYPIFAKPNEGIGSFGAFIITGINDTNVFLDRADPLTFEDLFNQIVGEKTYLLQTFIKNHKILMAFTQYLATIRMVNIIKKDELCTPFCCIKIPSPTNIADNYWRKGTLIADLDPKSGVIRRAIRGKGIETEEIDIVPESGEKLVGLTLPYWNELKEVNGVCAQLFAPVRYQSLDIALTQNGPIVIEINTGGSFELPQLASGTGLLTKEIREFFESCGWKFHN